MLKILSFQNSCECFYLKKCFIAILFLMVTLTFTQAQVSFQNPVPYLNENSIYGGNPAAVSIDMDGDGDLDIVTSNDNNTTNPYVIVGINNGSGVFTPSAKIITHRTIRDFAVGDLNNDGLPDVAVVAEPYGNWTFQVILNTSVGGVLSLGNAVSYGGLGFNAKGRGVSIADLNNDGNNDLIITKDNANEEFIVSHGNGTGAGWGVTQSFNVSGITGLARNVIGDFDGDNQLDVIASRGGSTGLWFFKGNSSGTFTTPSSIYTGRSISELTAADLNNDGLMDLILTNGYDTDLRLLININNGNGLSYTTTNYNTTYPRATQPTVADIDMDGNLDLMISRNWDAGSLGFAKGNGNGSFQAIQTFTYPENSASVASDGVVVGDFNADGLPDAGVVDRKIWLFINNSTVQPQPLCGSVLDFDGSNDYVSVPYSSVNNATVYSFSVWAKVEGSAGTYRSPISNRDDYPQRGWIIYAATNNKWQFWQGGGSAGWQQASTSVPVVINEWVHLAGTYDGTTMKFYVNGQLENTRTAVYSINPGKEMRIGAGRNDSPYSSYYYNGDIDEVSIWSRAISQTEIQNLMSNGLTGNETGLSSYFKFEDGTGSTTVTDLSGNNHNGTLKNMSASTDWEQSGAGCGGNTSARIDGNIYEENLSEEKRILDDYYTYKEQGMLHIVSRGGDGNASIQLIDLMGRTVVDQKATFSQQEWRYPTALLTDKVYILVVKGEQKLWKTRIIID